MTVYKVLGENRRPCHGGYRPWPLSDGKWRSVRGPLIPCQHGLHLCRRKDLVHWLGPTIWAAEYEGEMIVHDDSKIVVRKARLLYQFETWNERTARLFAADCAEYALRLTKKNGVVFDQRPFRAAIRAARAFAKGEISDEAYAAADSAYSAARSAAYSAARSAARSAADSAYSAAYSAAHSAADSAARSWQTRRLFDYLEGRRGRPA